MLTFAFDFMAKQVHVTKENGILNRTSLKRKIHRARFGQHQKSKAAINAKDYRGEMDSVGGGTVSSSSTLTSITT